MKGMPFYSSFNLHVVKMGFFFVILYGPNLLVWVFVFPRPKNSSKKLQVTFTLQVNLADHGYVLLASAMGLVGGVFLNLL
jgi:hypothetical protein